MAVRFVYITTEEKILSGENREMLEKLRPGMWPTVNKNNQVIIVSWELSQDMIRNYLIGPTNHNGGITIFVDEDHPQLKIWRSVKQPLQELIIVKNGSTDYPVDDTLITGYTTNTVIVLSPDKDLPRHFDLASDTNFVMLYKPFNDTVEDVGSEGLLNRVLLANRRPTKFIWHCEKIPTDVKQHGLNYFKTYFETHYPHFPVEVLEFDGKSEQLLHDLKDMPK